MKKNADEIPVLTSAQIRGASTVAQRRQAKRANQKRYDIRLRVDGDVYRWLRKSGPDHPLRVNRILRDIMELSNA